MEKWRPSFKPCYKWNAFNTGGIMYSVVIEFVGFKPCYKWNAFNTTNVNSDIADAIGSSFKPCYKWNAFNTV